MLMSRHFLFRVATAITFTNKSSMEHIPRAQPHRCMLLENCLNVLPMSMNMFVLFVYLHAQGIHAGREGLCCCSDLVAIVCILIHDTFDY